MDADRILPSFTGANICKFSPKGSFAAVADDQFVHLIDMQAQVEIPIDPRDSVSAMRFSPKETFLITCSKFNKAQRVKNMLIWSTADGSQVAGLEWPKNSKEGPKSFKFTPNEQYCAILAGKNLIDIYATGDFSKPFCKLFQAPKINKKGEEIKTTKAPSSYRFDGYAWCP